MQRAFSWKCRAVLRAEEARKQASGLWRKKVTRQSRSRSISVQTRSQRSQGERDGDQPAPHSASCGCRREVRTPRLPEHPPKLYLHNASTFSPGGTCGAIPSRPLRRRSWCTPLGLGPVQQRGGWARSRHSRRLPVALRRGPRSPAAHLRPTGRAGLRGAPDLRVQASARRSANVNRNGLRR